jgi:hypothetical protein
MTYAIAEGLNERIAAREKQAEEKEAEAQDIKVKAESLEIGEEIDDEAAEKGKKNEPKVHKLRDKEADGEAKSKKPRKTISKKG